MVLNKSMEIMKKNVYLSIVYCLCACQSPKHDNGDTKYKYEIQRVADKTFVLDEETTQDFDCLQYYKKDTIDGSLFFNNSYDNSIVEYNHRTSDFVRKIKLDKEGANGVGTSIFVRYLTKDSILICNYASKILFLVNDEGDVFWKKMINIKFNLDPDSLFLPPNLMPRTNNPMLKVGDEFLLSGAALREERGENSQNRPVLVWYNWKMDKIRYSDSYPPVYHKGSWGGSFTYRFPYYTINASGNIVMSFAADPNIRVIDVEKNNRQEYYAGIKDAPEITPVSNDDFKYNDELDTKHFVETMNYSSIHYDEYRHVYYRIVQLPMEKELKKGMDIQKPLVLLVLDEDFQVVAQCRLKEDQYRINNCYVAPDGFHIQLFPENDDVLRFSTFTLNAI